MSRPPATPARPAAASRALERPEHRLLLLCARARVSTEAAARIKSLAASGLDWDYLYRLARRHSVLPLLYRQLSAAAPRETPPAELRRLRDDFRKHIARNLYLTGELERVVGLFESERVPVIPYK
ncbi:MAG TPA: nucleotidyltransferase family protein, partial [Pyrinomonadaceae bacterium]|nr:nucleotidyltransferase family protein [Pyrinomonadaceae bacterium]